MNMESVFKRLSKDEVETFGLVLLSQGIVHQAVRKEDGWEMRIDPSRAAEAEQLIHQYLEENTPDLVVPEDIFYDYKRSLSGVWGALLLAAVHVYVYVFADTLYLRSALAASAGRILDGDWYRAATALLLHADIVHLIGNMAGIAILGSAVCSIMGWGVGWLAIVSSGIAGNVLNAVVYKAGHSSIGASTAVFGALGILSAWQVMRRARKPEQRLKALMPLGAGLALLGFMGSSAHADILAHLFGFCSGITIGGLYGATVKEIPEVKVQAAALMITAVILLRTWMGA
ncbi:MAG: rhomboid family intramembrane serine protease, partial [Thermodesulfobacteriota bacterium]